MKKYLGICLVVMIVCGASSALFAKNGLSAGFGFGYNDYNIGQGSHISIYDWDRALMIEAENKKNGTNSALDSSQIVPLDFSIFLRYDFIKFLFVRVQFNYTYGVPGKIEYTFAATDAKSIITGNYGAWHIPFAIGFNGGLLDEKLNLYLGLGFTYGSATYRYTDKTDSVKVFDFEYNYGFIGPYALVGVDYMIVPRVGLFVEVEFSSINGSAVSEDKMTPNSYDSLILSAGGLVYRCGVTVKII